MRSKPCEGPGGVAAHEWQFAPPRPHLPGSLMEGERFRVCLRCGFGESVPVENEEAARRPRPMRVLVTGSREWTIPRHGAIIERELRRLPPGSVVVEGEASGVDRIARKVAKRLGFEVVPFPADWAKYGKAAGPVRNRAMFRDGGPFDLVIAFHDDLANSRGTRDMVNVVRKNAPDLSVRIVTGEESG